MILDDIEKKLDSGTTAEDIAGGENISAGIKKLMISCHPDKFMDPALKKRAEKVVARLGELKFTATSKETIHSPIRTYTLDRIIGRGDISVVRLVTSEKDKYVAKISFPGTGRLMRNENTSLRKVADAASNASYLRYFPNMVDHFALPDGRVVNVFDYMGGLFTANAIMEAHPTGVGPKHIVWMFKRLLTAIGHAHAVGLVHGSVLPPHLMYHVECHGMRLVDWTMAVPAGKPIMGAPTLYKEWYPNECQKKHPVTPATDIYMAAKCMCWLSGGDPLSDSFPSTMPGRMQSYFRGCLLQSPFMRPQDAWKCVEEFDDMARQIYGAPKFQTMSM